MNVRQQLARAALAVLNPSEFGLNIGFTMTHFCNGLYSSPNVCGTSCCYGGHYIVLHQIDTGEVDQIEGRWCEAFENLTEIHTIAETMWLTSGGWVNSPEECAERVRMYLEDDIPDEFNPVTDRYPMREDTPMVLREIMCQHRP